VKARRALGSAAVALLAAAGASAQSGTALPAGTRIPVRFLQAVTSGRDTVDTRIIVQTMAALAIDSCVAVPPFVQVTGRVSGSSAGGRMDQAGSLMLRFDTLDTGAGHFPLRAVLDSLEFVPPEDFRDSGLVVASRHRAEKLGLRLAPAAVLASVGVFPAALLGGVGLLRRGPRIAIIAGEIGVIRLTEPLTLPASGSCIPVASHPTLRELPSLPRFAPRTESRSGVALGDPFNLVFLGTGQDLDGAFRRAGWVRAQRPSIGALTKEIAAAIADRPALGAPVSTQYFEGRRQDLAYESPSPTARVRHHVRIWLVDSLAMVWVGAATYDVGLRIAPWEGMPTHRISPEIDAERDLIVRELEATGCADLVDYVRLPGAPRTGRNAFGERFETDGRAAVSEVRECR
jgi:hypothetical protein